VWHRHLLGEAGYSVAAVEDILDRGGVDDWRELAAAVRSDPHGAPAHALEAVLANRYMYGTTVIWARFLQRCRGDGALVAAAEAREPGSEFP
jgi:hypothetical protein